MSEQRAASSEQRTGAAEAAPVDVEVEEEVVVDAEVVEEAPSADGTGDDVAAELDELAEAQRERDSYL